MAEEVTRFPEFEKLLEQENSSVYSEEFQHHGRVFLLSILTGYSLIPSFMFFFGVNLGIIVYIGLLVSPVGLVFFCREYVSFRSLREKYYYRGLSRSTISNAIMYIEAHSLEPEELESPPPYHDLSKHTTYLSYVDKREFAKFLATTASMITWPRKLIDVFTIELHKMRKLSIQGFFFLSITLFIFILSSYFLISSMVYYAIAFGFMMLMYGLSIVVTLPRVLSSEKHLLNLNWLATIEKSDSIELDELMHSIFKLLQDEYHHPLRFHFWRKYSFLEYTGRGKTYDPHLQLREAVFYPLS